MPLISKSHPDYYSTCWFVKNFLPQLLNLSNNGHVVCRWSLKAPSVKWADTSWRPPLRLFPSPSPGVMAETEWVFFLSLPKFGEGKEAQSVQIWSNAELLSSARIWSTFLWIPASSSHFVFSGWISTSSPHTVFSLLPPVFPRFPFLQKWPLFPRTLLPLTLVTLNAKHRAAGTKHLHDADDRATLSPLCIGHCVNPHTVEIILIIMS